MGRHQLQDVRQVAEREAVLVAGPNLSGRTQVLRVLSGLPEWDGGDAAMPAAPSRPMAYVGPEIYNSISGLALSVEGELRLHAGSGPGGWLLAALVERAGFAPLMDRNPFTLSGGEQACLAVMSAMALQPEVLALDCALEQIDASLQDTLLKPMGDFAARGTALVVSDNRMSERSVAMRTVPVEGLTDSLNRNFDFRLGPIDGTVPVHAAGTAPCTVEIDGLQFGYSRALRVLRDVSITLTPGTLYHLMGSNGAGKSTFAKLLAGVLDYSTGSLRVRGSEHRPWQTPGKVVSYHFQNPDLQLFSTSVRQEVTAGARTRNDSVGARHDEPIGAILKAFGLEGVLDEHPLDLPYVIRKRVALAATIASGSEWLVLDEPTLGQDDNSSRGIAAIIDQLLSQGRGVIVITHSEWFRDLLPGKRLMLQDGELHSRGAG